MSSSGDDCTNLQQCFGMMSGGDTLIIRDGVYTGDVNRIYSGNHPPAGPSRSSPTTLQAENVGEVFFDGQNTRQMFQFLGVGGGTSYLSNWNFVGLQWVNSVSYGIELTGGTTASDFTTGDYGSSLPNAYIKFKNCGFHGEDNSVQLAYMKYILFEDCWTWGNGRYGYNLYLNDHVIVRRNVDRRDAAHSGGSVPTHFG